MSRVYWTAGSAARAGATTSRASSVRRRLMVAPWRRGRQASNPEAGGYLCDCITNWRAGKQESVISRRLTSSAAGVTPIDYSITRLLASRPAQEIILVVPNAPASSRRDFLKASTVAGATLATLSLAPAVHAAGGDTLKVGLIGCGDRGRGAATQALNADKNVKLHALGDVFEDKLQYTLK